MFVNGKRLLAEESLMHRDRIILAEHFHFRFRDPREAERLRKENANKAAEKKKAGKVRDSREAAFQIFVREKELVAAGKPLPPREVQECNAMNHTPSCSITFRGRSFAVVHHIP